MIWTVTIVYQDGRQSKVYFARTKEEAEDHAQRCRLLADPDVLFVLVEEVPIPRS